MTVAVYTVINLSALLNGIQTCN